MGTSYAKGKQSYMNRPPQTMGYDIFKVYDADTYNVNELPPLGSRYRFEDGREFVFCKNGAVALAAGKVVQAPVHVTTHEDMATNTAAIGDYTVTVTLGATNAATANQYQGGYLVVNDDTGEAQLYKVKSHPAADAAATCVITLVEPIRVAFGAGATATLVADQFNGVVIAPTTLTSHVIGVPVCAVTASDYFWCQVKGPAAVLGNGTLVVGYTVEPSGTTSGAVDPTAETTLGPCIGVVMAVSASTEYSTVNLNTGV